MYLCEEWRRSPYTKASRSFVKCLRGKAIFESQTVHQRLQGRYAPGCRCGCCVFLPPAMDVSDVSGSSTSKSQEIGHENPAFQCREKWAHGACILSGNNEPEPRGGCSLQMMLICRGPPPHSRLSHTQAASFMYTPGVSKLGDLPILSPLALTHPMLFCRLRPHHSTPYKSMLEAAPGSAPFTGLGS